jgi:hypothetical protein
MMLRNTSLRDQARDCEYMVSELSYCPIISGRQSANTMFFSDTTLAGCYMACLVAEPEVCLM